VAKRDLVAEGVGERLHRMIGRDAVAREVERAMELGQLQRAGAGEHAERGAAQRSSPHPVGVGVRGRERGSVVDRRTAAVAGGQPRI
jgi:hypothetical protein